MSFQVGGPTNDHLRFWQQSCYTTVSVDRNKDENRNNTYNLTRQRVILSVVYPIPNRNTANKEGNYCA